MSQPIAPRPVDEGSSPTQSSSAARPRKITTACGACKQRKTKCSGGQPCEACSSRKSPCIYDASSDQRRKIANQRNVQDLAEAQTLLERTRHLLGGIIATIRAGDFNANNDLVHLIRSGTDLSVLAAHMRNEFMSNEAIHQSFLDINFVIDGPEGLPSPTQILSQMPSQDEAHPGSDTNAFMPEPPAD